MNTNQPFQGIVSLEQFAASKGIKVADIKLNKTATGKHVLVAFGTVISTIKDTLKGASLAETAANIKAVNLCFGIPKTGAVDNTGRPAVACAMVSTSQWEELPLF